MNEHDLQNTILSFCNRHPKVAFTARFNSGMTRFGEGKDKRFIRFNTLKGCPDLIGMTKDGRFIAIEVKNPKWKKPKDNREDNQAAFIELVNVSGGLACFANKLEDVMELLK